MAAFACLPQLKDAVFIPEVISNVAFRSCGLLLGHGRAVYYEVSTQQPQGGRPWRAIRIQQTNLFTGRNLFAAAPRNSTSARAQSRATISRTGAPPRQKSCANPPDTNP